MAAKPQICVIGLGKFGYKVGVSLIHLNHQVIKGAVFWICTVC